MIHGRMIEQIAMRVASRDDGINRYAQVGLATWVADDVHAIHLFADPQLELGEDFQVKLAFNYDLFDGGAKMEYELIELVQGRTVQLPQDQSHGLSHYGYHTENQDASMDKPDSLSQDLSRWIQAGFRVVQVSQTILHANTKRRYRYAFVDTRQLHGAYLKVIQRMSMPSDERTVKIGKDQFRWLADQRRA